MAKVYAVAVSPYKDMLKIDGMRGNEESATEPYYLVRRRDDDEIDEAERDFRACP